MDAQLTAEQVRLRKLMDEILEANKLCRVKSFVMEHSAVFYTAMVVRELLQTARWTKTIPTAAVCSAGLLMNPDFMEGLTPPQRNFVLMHEALHLRQDHLRRCSGLDHDMANIAADLAINCKLVDWCDIATKVTEKWQFATLLAKLDDGCFPGEDPFQEFAPWLSLEEYYKLLQQKKPKGKGGQQGGQQGQPGQPGQGGQGGGQGDDEGDDGEVTITDPDQLPDDLGNQQGGGGGKGVKVKIDSTGWSQEQWDKLMKKLQGTGTFSTEHDDQAKEAQLLEQQAQMLDDAAKEAGDQIDVYQEKYGKKIQGGLTKEMLDDYLNGNEDQDSQSARRIKRVDTSKQMSSGSSLRGVDGIVDRSDDPAMWADILDPIREKILTDEMEFDHRIASRVSMAESLSSALGGDMTLSGRVEGWRVGGEVLCILDTSGSTCDYWQLSVAKCVECVAAMPESKVIIRCLVFSDHKPSPSSEYLFYNGEICDEADLNTESVVQAGAQVPAKNIVDISEFVDQGMVEIHRIVGNTIQGGGGTELLPTVNAIKEVVGEDVSQRFLVTVIITDAALYGPDVPWSRSSDVAATFGDHVAWLFLDLYDENYDEIQGEKKYLISCK